MNSIKYTLKKTEASTLRCTVRPTHKVQYSLLLVHRPLEHELGVIRTVIHRAETVPTKTEGKEKEQNHISGELKTCGYSDWTFVKTSKKFRADRVEETKKLKSIINPYVAGTSENLRRIFDKHRIPVHFKPTNTLRHKQSNVVYAVQCSQDCTDLYTGETKQPLHIRMAQHRRANSSGQGSAVHSHLKETNHSFEDSNVNILAL